MTRTSSLIPFHKVTVLCRFQCAVRIIRCFVGALQVIRLDNRYAPYLWGVNRYLMVKRHRNVLIKYPDYLEVPRSTHHVISITLYRLIYMHSDTTDAFLIRMDLRGE